MSIISQRTYLKNSLIHLSVATAQVTLIPIQKHHILSPLVFGLVIIHYAAPSRVKPLLLLAFSKLIIIQSSLFPSFTASP